jgi:hypothetical protein
VKPRNIDLVRVATRMPPDGKVRLEKQALTNITNLNAEIVRAIGFRREGEQQQAAG